MRVFRPAYSTDRISGCAILTAAAVGGVAVFVVALPLALSSPFPTPKQGEWIIRNPAYDAATSFMVSPLEPPAMEPLRAEPSMVTPAPGDPEVRPQPVTFTERWNLTLADAIPIPIPVPNEAPAIEVPAAATRLAPPDKTVVPSPPRRSIVSTPDPVDRYLWEVYQRKPIKSDSTGDFTWKDPAAAKRRGLSLQAYVIGGMDPDFREQLYHAGRAMDAHGIRWSMLSAFRDDYRQALATGFKAHGGNSQHGGSNATGGYGHGRAIDITGAEGDSTAVWYWIDAHGEKFGLRRPMPGADPAHIQPRNTFHDLAHELREARIRLANELSGIGTEPAAGRTRVAARTDEAGDGRRVRR